MAYNILGESSDMVFDGNPTAAVLEVLGPSVNAEKHGQRALRYYVLRLPQRCSNTAAHSH